MNNKLKFLLIASLLGNALLGGFLIGEMSRGFGRWSAGDRLDAFPEASREKVRAAMDKMLDENKKTWEALREARRDSLKIVEQDPFDEAAWNAQIAKIEALRMETGKRMAETVSELARSLPPEERPALARLFERPYGGWKDRRSDKDEKPQDKSQ